MSDRAGTGSGGSSHGAEHPRAPIHDELIIEAAERTGEGESEGLTLRVRGFHDSASLGAYLAHGGIRTVPSEPGATQPEWWDLFFAGADAGIAYAPADGVSRIELESSAALAHALPLAILDGRRIELGGLSDLKAIRAYLAAGEYELVTPAGAGPESNHAVVHAGREVGRMQAFAEHGGGLACFEFDGEEEARSFERHALAEGHVGVANAEIADAVRRYLGRHHRAAHESSHVARNSIFVLAGVAVLVALIPLVNRATGGGLFKGTRAAAVRIGMVKEAPPAFIVTDTGHAASAGNILAFGAVYLEFPDRVARSGDTVTVAVPPVAPGDRIYTAGTTRPDSSGGIVQIIVARIVDAAGVIKYSHPAGALPVPSYRLLASDQWGPVTPLESLGSGYVEALEKQLGSSKRIRLQGTLSGTTGGTGSGYVLASGGHSVVLAGPLDALTAVRLAQFRDGPVDLCGNITRILPDAYRGGKPTGEPMLEMNPQGVIPLAGR